MKEQYVSQLGEGDRVDTLFVLRSKELRAARTGEAYLHMELADRTGRLPAIKFRPNPEQDAAPVGTVVRVRGRVTSYRGVLRVSLEQMRPAPSFERSDFVSGPRRDAEETARRLRDAVSGVGDAELRSLLRAVFGDADFRRRFLESPAAQVHHHAYLGGLAEHTLAVTELCDAFASLYEHLDRDLLITAALLHDIGKLDELAFDTGIEYTDEGRLLGHVVLGDRRVREAAQRCERRPEANRLTLLSHILLSHHGELEWGAPKRPATLEALLLHHADNLDAKAAGFLEIVENASAAEERWTDVGNLFRRPLYAPASAEADRPVRPCEDDEQYRLSA